MNSVLGCDNLLKCKTISWCTRNSKLRQVIDYHYYFYVACRNRDRQRQAGKVISLGFMGNDITKQRK